MSLRVANGAEENARDERAMMERLEATYDDAVDASLEAVGRDDLDEQLRKYLADAHAIEEQAIALLERGPKLAGSETLANIYADHLGETRDHAEAIEARLDELGGDPSTLKDAALRLGALNWGAFFQAHPDTPASSPRSRVRSSTWRSAATSSSSALPSEPATTRPCASSSEILVQEREASSGSPARSRRRLPASLEHQGVAPGRP